MAEKTEAQLTLDQALEGAKTQKPTTLADGTVLKWVDSENKESPSEIHQTYDRIAGEVAVAKRLGRKIPNQGVVGLKAATAEDERRARQKVADLDTRRGAK
jgi:hypothetical protein